MSSRGNYFIPKIESFEGEDTHIRCGDDLEAQDFLFCVIATDADGTAVIIDGGYRSLEEVRRAWPEV